MSRLDQPGEYENRKAPDLLLPAGSTIIGGRYRIERLLYRRPRLNLYLGRRISPGQRGIYQTTDREPRVTIRELVLTGLTPLVRAQIEQAAFEEFVSPVTSGTPYIATFARGDRAFLEGERHYLVTQLSEPSGMRQLPPDTTILLDELLSQPQWPCWLDTAVALDCGTQLSRVVARLHRLGVVLGDLGPGTILIDRSGSAGQCQAPLLLHSWPPPPALCSSSMLDLSPVSLAQYASIFPIADASGENPFTAPEVVDGVYDQRSDVYSLGAVLYLLCTHYAPAAVLRRHYAAWMDTYGEQRKEGQRNWIDECEAVVRRGSEQRVLCERFPIRNVGLELIPPRLLNTALPMGLENILLRALAFDPAERYPSAFALTEALEECHLPMRS